MYVVCIRSNHMDRDTDCVNISQSRRTHKDPLRHEKMASLAVLFFAANLNLRLGDRHEEKHAQYERLYTC